MAEDEGAKTGGDPADPTKHSPGETPPPASPHPDSEWTASDSRGPLAAAREDREASEREAAARAENFGSAEPTDRLAPSDLEAPAHPLKSAGSEPSGEAIAAAVSKDPPPTVSEPQPRSAWPIVAGLLAGAAVGAIVALVVYRSQDGAADPQVASLAAKVTALESRPDAGALKSSVADLQAKVAALQSSVAALPKPPPASAQKAFDPAPLQQKIDALGASVAELQKQGAGAQGLDAKVGGLATAVAGLEKQTASNGSGLQVVQDQQKSLAGKVGAPALAVVADSLVQAIDAGRPYATQVDALASFGADPAKLAVLKQNAQAGVPSAKALAAKFAPLAEPILATEHKAPPDAGFMERLKSGAFSLVSVRKSDDLSGSTLSSAVARIQADLAHDDLADAVTTWGALPADAKAKSEAWGALAKTSAEALTAAHGLQSDAIAALGGKKS